MSSEDKCLDRRVAVAPMMGWTDRHDRYFLRLISRNALLYTVMITTGAIIHGKKLEILAYNPEEHPVALQLGGSDPKDLAACSRLAEQYGYDEVNLNCGCPSPRVQNGKFGACLMAEPLLVANCVEAMRQAVSIPVTVKTRIGIDEQDSYQFLADFVGTVAAKGCGVFIIHARKALLDGLSPAENRTIPPLQRETAYRLKRDFPHLSIIVNGGIRSIGEINAALENCDGVMIGREAYQNPYFLAEIERAVFGTENLRSRDEIVDAMMPYIDRALREGAALKDITRHMLGLYQGMPGARRWRQVLSQEAYKPAANMNVVQAALSHIRQTG
jgi:tRNA-dihydrouridine synthase A